MSHDRAARIRATSRALKRATWLAALATAALYPVAFVVGPVADGALPVDRAVLFLAGAVPLAFGLVATVRTARLFARFEAGLMLDGASAVLLSRIGTALCAAAVLGVAARVGASVVLAVRRGGGAVELSIGSGDVAIFGVGLLLVVLGRVLGEAVAVAEENRQFV